MREHFLDSLKFCQQVKIRDKWGVQQPLQPFPGQIKLANAIDRQAQRGLPIRICFLKARQVMASTWASFEVFKRSAFLPGQQALVYAHLNEATRNLYGYYEQFFASYEPYLGLRALHITGGRKDQSIELEGGGGIEFRSAETAKGGRSASIRLLHLSEVAFWRDPDQLRTGLLQGVPFQPGTLIIDESTANGKGGAFYRQWRSIEDPNASSDWIGVFLGWHEHPEYVLPVEDAYHFERSLTDDEQSLRQRYRLSLEQIHWRRRKLATDCEGDERRFQQEYPACPSEAFLASGSPYFDLRVVARQMRDEEPTCGVLQRIDVGLESRLQFVPRDKGPLALWRRPQPGHRYAIGADSAEGIDAAEGRGTADPDWSVAQVLDVDTGEQVARWRARREPAEFARWLIGLATYYNGAFVVPERNNHGTAVISALIAEGWPLERMYNTRRDPYDRRPALLQECGWLTTAQSKPTMLAWLANAWREGWLQLRDGVTLAEVESFVTWPNGTAAAMRGEHDDCVIALALAVIGIMHYPRQLREQHTGREVVRAGRISYGSPISVADDDEDDDE